MREGVVADDVASLGNFAGDLGTLLYVASDEEKSRVNAMFGEDLEQAQGVGVVGPVVVGEGDLARAMWESGESLSIPLSCRGHGLVADGDSGCGGGDAGQGQSEHAGIVLH